MKQKKVVRVVLPDGINDLSPEVESLLEQLRYAGLITIHNVGEDRACFDLHCPHGLVDEVWARQNAERMKSFQYNAVVAPSTSRPEENLCIKSNEP